MPEKTPAEPHGVAAVPAVRRQRVAPPLPAEAGVIAAKMFAVAKPRGGDR